MMATLHGVLADEARLQSAHARGLTDVSQLHDRSLGWGDVLVAHDPDGHATLFASDGKALAEATSPETTH